MNAKNINPNTKPHDKPQRWLTRNRLWNLIFMVAFPVQIVLTIGLWSWLMLLFTIATVVFICGFAPVDKSAVENRDPRAMRSIKYAGRIFSFSIFLLIFSLLLGASLSIFTAIIFFIAIFIIPITIITFANIPFGACIESCEPHEIPRGGFLLSSSDGRTSLGVRASNNSKLL